MFIIPGKKGVVMFVIPGKKNTQSAAVAMSIISTRQGYKFLHKMGGTQGTVFACWSVSEHMIKSY